VSQPGRYELPPVRFCTFQPGSGYTIQTLPPVELVVLPGSAAPLVAAVPAPPKTMPGRLPPLLLVGAAFVAGALCVAALGVWRAHRRVGTPLPAVGADPVSELRHLQLTVERWARTRFSVTVAEGVARLVAAGCPPAEAEEAVTVVQACERLRFAPSLQDPADAVANLRVRAARLVGHTAEPADTLGE
jgi:hypothetical protein